jgi:hypothetical protein
MQLHRGGSALSCRYLAMGTAPVIGTKIAPMVMISITLQWHSPTNPVFKQFSMA